MSEYTNLLEYDFGTTDGFKKLLKCENHIFDFQKATGQVFSDRLKCAIVLSRSPAPIKTYLRIQNRGDYGALRVALMNYLEAGDDGHGPVPMEVVIMKGKQGAEARRAMAEENLARILESATNEMSTTRGTIITKAVRKEEKEERKAKQTTKKKRETSC